jgi:DNA-binding response OmpR family regulator
MIDKIDRVYLDAAPSEECSALTILVVDDERTVRSFLYTCLDRAGYVVLAASDGQEALEICRHSRRRIDLIVTDLDMPRMTGTELANLVEMPVLFISGSASLNLSDLQITSPHRRDLLHKPFRAGELLRRTRALIPASAAAVVN